MSSDILSVSRFSMPERHLYLLSYAPGAAVPDIGSAQTFQDETYVVIGFLTFGEGQSMTVIGRLMDELPDLETLLE